MRQKRGGEQRQEGGTVTKVGSFNMRRVTRAKRGEKEEG